MQAAVSGASVSVLQWLTCTRAISEQGIIYPADVNENIIHCSFLQPEMSTRAQGTRPPSTLKTNHSGLDEVEAQARSPDTQITQARRKQVFI